MKDKKIDLRLIICLIFFFIISITSIYSSLKISNNSIDNIFIKQIIFYIIGIVLLLIAYYNKNYIIKHSLLWYIGFNILLFALLFFGISINGSKCWIILGPLSFQPSEFMKIFLIIIISNILNKYKNVKTLKKEFIMLTKIAIVLLIPSILTFLEPDTGVVIIYFLITISMVLYRGINKKWYLIFLSIFLTIIGIIVTLYFCNQEIFKNIINENILYRLDRILNWSSQTGYQLENSLIVIASSGLFGFGFNNIPLYYPEANTDFIFTTYNAIFGFIGSLLLIVIIIVFDTSIINLCNKKIKKQDQYLLVGIFTMILYQQIQNISMTIGLLPITGITLPFISYGGSSLLSYMFICGIILKIIKDENKYIN